MVRCSICRLYFSNLKSLNSHYHKHSKARIIKCLLRSSILISFPSMLRRRNRNKNTKQIKQNVQGNMTSKSRTLYLKEDFHILCSQNEVIIGDGPNSMNTLFSFDKPSQTKGKKVTPKSVGKMTKTGKNKNPVKKIKMDYSSRSSASSECSNVSLKIKKKVKRKKQQPFKKHYHINITKLHNTQSLDERSGDFYNCDCRLKNKASKSFKKADLRILTSDTESCSDTGKTCFQPIVDTRLFCPRCGNGYKTKTELTEHMYIHETFCRLCNTSFVNEFKFREHMRLHIFKVFICHLCNAEFLFKELFFKHFEGHIEEKTLENILNMEGEYKTLPYSFLCRNYNTSISNIICFLNEYPEINYYSQRIYHTCDICGIDVAICDYERHCQNLHTSFLY